MYRNDPPSIYTHDTIPPVTVAPATARAPLADMYRPPVIAPDKNGMVTGVSTYLSTWKDFNRNTLDEWKNAINNNILNNNNNIKAKLATLYDS